MDDQKVAVLIEDLMSKFRTFGEGLQSLNEKFDTHIEENRKEFKAIQNGLDRNHLEHHQLMQMVKELDNEVQTELKRVK